ncbi:MAG TPA: hypothetical protein VNK52_05340 [Hyphomicrobiaceae bacterium]|nr:hypothetical protein [Hyphomicrobiaceae bacterium]
MSVDQCNAAASARARGPLTRADAVDIWIARWLRVRRKDLCARYQCDPRRLYEIWEERKFAGTREEALQLFHVRYPSLVDRIDYGRHRRIPRTAHPDQLTLFERPADVGTTASSVTSSTSSPAPPASLRPKTSLAPRISAMGS